MKVVVTADWHFGVPGRLNDIVWATNRVREYCKQHGINKILILGDLTHDRETLGLPELCAVTQCLEDNSAAGIETIVFPGNHDMFQRNSWEINSLRPFSKHVTVHNKVSRFTLDGRRFWVIPFIHYESNYMEVLRKVEEHYKEGDVLLTHVGIKSATLNTCFLLKSWSVVDFSDSKFKWVYTGHFHTMQKVGDNVWYPGSLIPFKADEGDVDHGFFVLDTETMQHQFVSIWAGVERTEDVPPQFLTLDDDSLENRQADVKGNIVRVALSREYTVNQLHEIQEKLKAQGARQVRWMQLSSSEETQDLEAADNMAATASDMFTDYVNQDPQRPKELDLELLSRLNLEIVTLGDQRYEFPEE